MPFEVALSDCVFLDDWKKGNIVPVRKHDMQTCYESDGSGNKNLSLKDYLDKNKPDLKDMIVDLQESDTRKIHLTIAIDSNSKVTNKIV